MVAGQSFLIRQDRQRILKIQAQIDPEVTDANAVHNGLAAEEILQLKQQFPGLDINIGEERQEQEETAQTLLFLTAIALTVIYALIAIPFQVVKPLIFLRGAPSLERRGVAQWLLGFTCP